MQIPKVLLNSNNYSSKKLFSSDKRNYRNQKFLSPISCDTFTISDKFLISFSSNNYLENMYFDLRNTDPSLNYHDIQRLTDDEISSLLPYTEYQLRVLRDVKQEAELPYKLPFILNNLLQNRLYNSDEIDVNKTDFSDYKKIINEYNMISEVGDKKEAENIANNFIKNYIVKSKNFSGDSNINKVCCLFTEALLNKLDKNTILNMINSYSDIMQTKRLFNMQKFLVSVYNDVSSFENKRDIPPKLYLDGLSSERNGNILDRLKSNPILNNTYLDVTTSYPGLTASDIEKSDFKNSLPNIQYKIQLLKNIKNDADIPYKSPFIIYNILKDTTSRGIFNVAYYSDFKELIQNYKELPEVNNKKEIKELVHSMISDYIKYFKTINEKSVASFAYIDYVKTLLEKMDKTDVIGIKDKFINSIDNLQLTKLQKILKNCVY